MQQHFKYLLESFDPTTVPEDIYQFTKRELDKREIALRVVSTDDIALLFKSLDRREYYDYIASIWMRLNGYIISQQMKDKIIADYAVVRRCFRELYPHNDFLNMRYVLTRLFEINKIAISIKQTWSPDRKKIYDAIWDKIMIKAVGFI
ncbi:MAG: hypothetical protein Harvfovirus36_15 [Harvfovirus sp.]|uniref:Uncharacterized protein n=1 Tax=Harvfovirus sp. TaxID=2487768 RepID=A0A3G5A4R5_9VIRU|nr:MAG: hypothetical protein Harvfovirus36_15 [Harvfovirus sp.]